MGMMTRRNVKARVAYTALPYVDEPIKNSEQKQDFYTKTDINGMKVAELRELAKQQGIENADDISGSELKTILIENMGL